MVVRYVPLTLDHREHPVSSTLLTCVFRVSPFPAFLLFMSAVNIIRSFIFGGNLLFGLSGLRKQSVSTCPRLLQKSHVTPPDLLPLYLELVP